MNKAIRMTATAALVGMILVGSTVAGAATAAPAASGAASGTASSTGSSHSKDAVAKAGESKPGHESKLVKTVNEAYVAMRDVRAARLAILDGNTDQARQFVEEAEKNLHHAQSMIDEFAMPTNQGGSQAKPKDAQASSGTSKPANGKQTASKEPAAKAGGSQAKSADASRSTGGGRGTDDYIPFDVSLTLAEGFVPSPEKDAKMKQANASLAKGDRKQAVETLELADINVTMGAALVPARSSLARVQAAAKLIGEKKFHEANLELKAIEDSVIVEYHGMDTVPKQGKTASGPSVQPAKPAGTAQKNG